MVADNCVCFASCKQDRIKSLLMSQHVYSTLLASSEALVFILVYYRSSNSDLQHCCLFLFTKWLKRCKICYICRTHRVPTLLRLFFFLFFSSFPISCISVWSFYNCPKQAKIWYQKSGPSRAGPNRLLVIQRL